VKAGTIKKRGEERASRKKGERERLCISVSIVRDGGMCNVSKEGREGEQGCAM
jgi:hypothetical protein